MTNKKDKDQLENSIKERSHPEICDILDIWSKPCGDVLDLATKKDYPDRDKGLLAFKDQSWSLFFQDFRLTIKNNDKKDKGEDKNNNKYI